jgi:hypothetical protein
MLGEIARLSPEITSHPLIFRRARSFLSYLFPPWSISPPAIQKHQLAPCHIEAS